MNITEQQAAQCRESALKITVAASDVIDSEGASVDVALGAIGYLIVSLALKEAADNDADIAETIHKMYAATSAFVNNVALPEASMIEQAQEKEIH